MANSSLAMRVALGLLAIWLPGTSASMSTSVSIGVVPGDPYYSGQTVTLIAGLLVASGVPTGTVTFKIDGTPLTPVQIDSKATASLPYQPPLGMHTITASYIGDATYGASTSGPLSISVFKAPTSISMGPNQAQMGQPVTIQAAVTVQSPGVATPTGTVSFSNGGDLIPGCANRPVQSGIATCTTSFSQAASYTITTNYSGDTNTSSSNGSLQLTVSKYSPAVSLSADPPNPTNGTAVTLQARISGVAGVPDPTGTVTISDGSNALATVALVAGAATLVVPSASLAPFSPGTHLISAVYNGDANYQGSQSLSVSVTMGGKASTVTVAATNNPQIAQPVRITASIAVAGSAGIVPGGTVDFTNGTTAIAGCTGVSVQSVSAVCNTTFTQVGTVTIGASYSGDANTLASKGTMQLTVGKGTAQITLSATPTAPALAVPVTLTASVSGMQGLAGPTGNITFSDGTAVLGSAKLGSDGRASLIVPSGGLNPFTAGTHTIGATYTGDVNYQAASAATLLLAVSSKAAAVVTLSATPASPALGVPVTLTSTVTGVPGLAAPTGSVAFSDGAVVLGSVLLGSDGRASLTVPMASLPAFTVGSHNIGAVYNGDTNYTVSPAATLVLGVSSKSAPLVTLSATPASPALGAPVTLTALVSGVTGLGTPTGSVSFSDGATALGQTTLGNDGRASLTVPSGSLAAFTAGTHNIGAVYNGDANYSSSAAATLPVVVSSKPATTIGLWATPSSPSQGTPVTITALVAGLPGLAIPIGTVAFSDGAVALGSVTLGGDGRASLIVPSGSLTAFTAGTHNIGAVYSGDVNYAGSTATLALVVSTKSPTTTTLSATPSSPAQGTPVTITALVTGAAGQGTPTGTVAFTDGTGALGSATLGSDGRASLTVPSGSLAAFTTGTHNLGAVYSGDPNYAGSTAATLPLVVSKPATVVTLTSTAAQLAQAVKITASISVSGAGGSVDFTAGSSAIAGCTAVPVQSGAAVCNTSFSQLGAVTIGAAYSGDSTTGPATGSMQLTVAKCNPGVYIASSPSSPLYGATVTLGMLVMGAAGVANPTGTVTFSEGGTTLGTAQVGPDGHASLLVPSGSIAPLGAGPHTINGSYNGDSNYASATPQAMTVTIGKGVPTVTLTSAPTSPAPGQSTTLTAALSPVGIGTVTFNNGSTAITGCSAVTVQNGLATCVTTFAQTGGVSLTASYSGDANLNASSGVLALTVGQAAKTPSVSLVVNPTAPVFGAPVIFTLSVMAAPGGPTPTGTVAFSDGVTSLGSVPLGSAVSQASLVTPSSTIAALTVGTHTITATYSGDSYYASTAPTPLMVTVSKASTTTSLTAPYGGPFNATVAVVAPGAGTPTGQVQFSIGSSVIGTVALQPQGTAFVASFPKSTQTGSLTATYAGDTNFAGSTSAAVNVGAPQAQITLASNHNPSTSGQSVILTVTATADSGASVPTGTVQLLSDGAALGTLTLAAGTATYTTSSLAVGTHNLVANYSGDSIYPAASAGLLQMVNAGSGTLSLTSSAPSSVYGQPVTLTAQWGGSTNSAPTGQVQFSDGATSLGTAPMSGGTASLAVASLTVGPHSLTATCNGDSNWSSVTSGVLAQTVSKAQTGTVLAPGSTAGTYTATVLPVAPGAGIPTGGVKFVNGTTNGVITTVPLAASAATADLTGISDPIFASYSGDTNFQPSDSAPLTQIAVTNSASYSTLSVAEDEIVTLFGPNLGTAAAQASPPSTSLGGTTVTVTDNAGITRASQIFYVSATQASVLIPSGVAQGPGSLTVTNGKRAPVTTPLTIGKVSPGLFTSNATGQGVAAAQAIRVHADGTQDSPQNVGYFDSGQNSWMPSKIDLGSSTDTVYLLLYGTGIRHASATPSCTIGGKPAGVVYAGAQGTFVGLDQVNVLLPATLRGAGTVNLTLMVDGVTANTVTIAVQ